MRTTYWGQTERENAPAARPRYPQLIKVHPVEMAVEQQKVAHKVASSSLSPTGLAIANLPKVKPPATRFAAVSVLLNLLIQFERLDESTIRYPSRP